MSRVYNFSAGPAVLPHEVLEKAQAELVEWGDTGMSIMEMSHRAPVFEGIAERAEANLRALLKVPDSYKVLFLHGPARAQFSAVPLNLSRAGRSVDYLDTGLWSEMAINEARKYCEVNVAASDREGGYLRVPPPDRWRLDDTAAYLHFTPNETINGVEYHSLPDAGGVPLVADMSSNILSKPIDVERYALIYAGAQKNMGIAGLVVVIAREDLIGHAAATTPEALDYNVHATQRSMAHTPSVFAWYMAGLVFEWIEAQGGLEAMARRNQAKAGKFYAYLDGSNFYNNPVDPASRSLMNIPFTLADDSLDKRFLAEAERAGLANLKGHRFVGGMRASLYNAMPEEGVDALIEFMSDFVESNG
ncbi:MAG: 3-phosphoserine/phosphohydroxythreonine transaminase [Gammaproteobacteria bacterium]